MHSPTLSDFNLTPAQTAVLPARLRTRLLHFLLRWQAYAEVLASLAKLPLDRYVSLQDMQAEALDGLGRAAEAAAVMEKRLRQKTSIPARQRLARCLLHAGETERARALAQELTAQDDAPAYAWSLHGDVHRRRGELEAAEAAYLRHRRLAPNSRTPLLGLAQLYRQRGEPVTAAAYAVQAYTVEEGQQPLTIPLLRRLRTFFAESGDGVRQAEADAELSRRYAEELAELQAALDEETGLPVRQARREEAVRAPLPAPPPLPDLAAVPVSEEERRTSREAARRLFGFDSLLPAQAEIMACARRGENVLAILPTGGGKSLCYQLPAFLDDGLTLVISPLIALMKDQVDGLPEALRVQSVAINSSMDGAELEDAVQDIAAGRYRLVYAAPERLRQRPFLEALRRVGLARLVIDEAHCVSVWGHDFRPDYLYIARARRDLNDPPVLALTATAPVRVREDIERQLFGASGAGGGLRVIAADTFRSNLRLLAFPCAGEDEKLGRLLAICSALDGSGIVYARTRRRCEELAELLRRHGVQAEHYHAGIPDRAAVQDRFMQGRSRVIVATIAFGMGVDKPDIRFIVHYGLPDSVEAYYQEAGRAGRDGEPAHCILLHSSADKGTLTRNAKRSAVAVEFLRDLYRRVRRRANEGRYALTPLDDLMRELGRDDTEVRVGLSFLERAGLLVRHYDPPRSVGLRRESHGQDVAFDRFAAAAHLRRGQSITRPYAHLCAASSIPPTALEAQLLAWQREGHLSFWTSGRDLLLEVPTPPSDAPDRVEALLSQYAAIQQQRVTEIVRYARSRHCRHGHLAAYLGGLPRQKCSVCDNCGAALPSGEAGVSLPDEETQLRTVLEALSSHGWGRRNLARLLRGDPRVGERGRRSPCFGRLSFRSDAAIGQLIDLLIAGEYIRAVVLSHGGSALELSERGRGALATTGALDL